MAKVTLIHRKSGGPPEPSGALQRRLDRLRRAVNVRSEPIVWLRGGAGTGKSYLLASLKASQSASRIGRVEFLDDPCAAELETALAHCEAGAAGARRVVIASRPDAAAAGVLLRQQLYGRVGLIEESELYVTAADVAAAVAAAAVAAAADAFLLEETGGWPMLAAALAEGRATAVRELLPAFIGREVLPLLPEALTAAAFASLAAPLSQAEYGALWDGAPVDHPLLQWREEGWQVSGLWVREALLVLRRSASALSAGVSRRLKRHYSARAAPARVIVDLAAMGEESEALEVFRNAGGVFFGCRHGYRALQAVIDALGSDAAQRCEELYLARLWLLIKSGRPREALLKLEERHPGLPVDLRDLRLTYRAEALLLRLDISLDIDGTPPLEVIASWERLEGILPPEEHIARGMIYNTMAIGFLQADALVEAKRLAEDSLAAYRAAGSDYLAHCMQLHLCDIALRQGRLDDAADLLKQARAGLDASGHAFNSEPAILLAFAARIAFEAGRVDDAPEDIEPILQALRQGDSWPDLIARVSVAFVFTGFWRRGLRHALERLDQCALTLSRRHGNVAPRRLALLRIQLMQLARHHAEADMLLEEYELQAAERGSAALEVEEGLIRLRQAVARQRSRATIARLADTLTGRAPLEPRQRIAIALLQAAAHQAQGNAAAARRHLRMALREAESANLVAALLEDGEVAETLLPSFIAAPGPGNARLTQFAARVLRLLKSLPTAPLHSKALAGVSRQEHRVLSYVADGYTNKQIGRALALSESTVKFHLRSLFKKLRVASRAALADAARARGIAT